MNCTGMFICLGLILFSSTTTRAQVDWKLSGESGLRKEQPAAGTEHAVLANLDGRIGSKYEIAGMKSSFVLRLRPEIYDLERGVYALRSKVAVKAEREWEQFSGGVDVYMQRNFLHSSMEDIRSDVFFMKAPFDISLDSDLSVRLIPGIASQSVKSEYLKETETTFLDINLMYPVSDAFTGSAGVFAEMFYVHAEQLMITASSREDNRGYRYGLHVGGEWNSTFLAGVDARILLHQSAVTKPGTVENSASIFFGISAGENTSILCMYDWSKVNFRLSGVAGDENLLYVPFESENRLQVKAVLDMNEQTELYLSYNYHKENITFNRTIFDGEHLVLGIAISSK